MVTGSLTDSPHLAPQHLYRYAWAVAAAVAGNASSARTADRLNSAVRKPSN